MQNFFSKKQWLVVIITSLVIAGAFTGIGYKIGSKKSGFGPMNGQLQGRTMMGGPGRSSTGMRGNGNVAGTVLSQDAASLTLTLPQGGSRTVLITPTTTVLKTAPGIMGDIQKDSFLMVSGTSNADGSISASTLSIRPKPETVIPEKK
jgi:hypothetical protein